MNNNSQHETKELLEQILKVLKRTLHIQNEKTAVLQRIDQRMLSIINHAKKVDDMPDELSNSEE